ncbi:MAG: hypothetical protein AB7W59_05115 [Acidimicrobiia bacterium]
MANQQQRRQKQQSDELPGMNEADRANGEGDQSEGGAPATTDEGQSTPSMQDEEERAGVRPGPETAADEMD